MFKFRLLDLLLLYVVWAQLAPLAAAVESERPPKNVTPKIGTVEEMTSSFTIAPSKEYRYVLTYGRGAWVCTAVVKIHFNPKHKPPRPNIRLSSTRKHGLEAPLCTRVNENSRSRGVSVHPPASAITLEIYAHGYLRRDQYRNFEITLDQAGFYDSGPGSSSQSPSAPGLKVPKFHARVTLITNLRREPIGVCNYQVDAIRLHREQTAEGSESPRARQSCPLGVLHTVGKFLVCRTDCYSPER